MELIYKDKLIETLEQIPCWECDGPCIDECYSCIMERVVDAPAVDAVEVKHCTFVEDTETFAGYGVSNYKCTNCHHIVGTWQKGLEHNLKPYYCFICGSKNDLWRKERKDLSLGIKTIDKEV